MIGVTASAGPARLRPATEADAATILGWRNSAFIRERSSSKATVRPDEHEAWIRGRLADPACDLMIIESAGAPVGLVMIVDEATGGDPVGVVTVYLDEPATGRGVGISALRQVLDARAAGDDGRALLAHVRRDNPIGAKAFLKAGFQERTGEPGTLDEHRLFGWNPALALARDDARTTEHFAALFDVHSDSHRAVDWGSPQSQACRFAVLAEIGIGKNSHVLDVGCGVGAFSGWLAQQGLKVSLTGVDLNAKAIESARRTYPEHRFIHGSFLELSDLPEVDT